MPSGAADSVAVFCGTWQQPAAQIVTDGAGNKASPMGIATSGTWRQTIDLRFACDAPVVTSNPSYLAQAPVQAPSVATAQSGRPFSFQLSLLNSSPIRWP